MIPSTGPNLARAPFVNARPVHRLSALLWLLALALVAWNVHAYLDSGAGATVRRAELARLREENAESRARIQTLEEDLRRADLVRVNLQTEYLNQRIAERAFSWNLLLDDLIEVLPRQVRVQRLAPEGFRDDRLLGTGRTPSSDERRVLMRLSGEAANGEALLEFVDRIFAHPSFDSPNLSSEALNSSGNLDFELTVGYRAAGDRTDAAPPSDAPPAANARTASPASPSAAADAAADVAAAGSATVTAPSAAPSAAPATTARGRDVEIEPAPRRVGGERIEPEPVAASPAPEPAVAEATPVLSIFGVPLGAKPHASGGGG